MTSREKPDGRKGKRTKGWRRLRFPDQKESRRTIVFRLFGAATLAAQTDTLMINVRVSLRRVNCAAVLTVGFEPTWALAQQGVSLSRLPISPRQHHNRQRTSTSPWAVTPEVTPAAVPQGNYMEPLCRSRYQKWACCGENTRTGQRRSKRPRMTLKI